MRWDMWNGIWGVVVVVMVWARGCGERSDEGALVILEPTQPIRRISQMTFEMELAG